MVAVTRQKNIIKFKGNIFNSYASAVKSSLRSQKPQHWTKNTIFPIETIGQPFLDERGTLVTKIHYIGWHSAHDEIRPVADLISIKGTGSVYINCIRN